MSDPDVCVFCEATGCLANEAQHGPQCPFTTNMWPISEVDVHRGAECAACETPFVLGDLTYEVDAADHPAAIAFPGATIGVCLGCAATGREVQP